MHDNTTAFREAFNRIENYLRRKGSYDTWKDFASILKEQAAHDGTLRQYVDELDAMRELRNVLVHQEGVSKSPIANPYPTTVKRLDDIYQALTNPPTVSNVMIRNITTTDPSKALADELQLMREKCFTILPVIEKEIISAILSEYTLLKWCSARLDKDGAILEAQTVGDISEFLDTPDASDPNATYQFVARDATLSSIHEKFDGAVRNGVRLNAVFITQHGKQSEKLLGLITPWDIT